MSVIRRCSLEISQSLSPPHWHWVVVVRKSGMSHIFAVSRRSYRTLPGAALSAMTRGLVALHQAMRLAA